MKNILVIIALTISLSVLALGSERGRQSPSDPPELVSFPTQDGGIVSANLYGKGSRGVVLAHGGRFTKESWEKQARELVNAGFRVLAIDFRGRGQSRGPTQAQPTDDGVRYDCSPPSDTCVRTAPKPSQ